MIQSRPRRDWIINSIPPAILPAWLRESEAERKL